MNKVFLFALQLGVLAPFWRSMQALLWANSGRVSEGGVVEYRLLRRAAFDSLCPCPVADTQREGNLFLDSAVCGVLLGVARLYGFRLVGASERGIPPVSVYGLAVDGVIYAAGLAWRVRLPKRLSRLGRQYIIHVRNRILICVLWMKL